MRRIAAALLLAVVAGPAMLVMAQDATTVPAFPGKIAYIGSDYNVYTFNGSDRSRTPLTEDAGASAETLLAYEWPTWSTDGRLAYFGLSVDWENQQPSTTVFVSEDGLSSGEQVYDGEAQVYNYAYWAPQNCPSSDSCRDLAVLLSDPTADGLLVERVRVGGEASSTTLGEGAPFYFSWSPDGTRMLWQRNNQRLDVYDVAAEEVVTTLEQRPGLIAAPAWSPIDDRLLVGVRGADVNRTDLTILGSANPQTLAEGLAGPVSFNWSPDGNRVAYTADRGPLTVLDAVTGETLARSPVGGVYAFFWAPNGHRLVYVTLAVQPGSFNAGTGAHMAMLAQQDPALAWSVLDVETSANWRLASFLPTQDELYLLSFFDQFAQSHRIWSPDSRHIVYGELTSERQPVITVLNVENQDTVPLTIAEGHIGVWSFE